MRTGSVNLQGQTFPICLSTRVVMALEEKGLTLETVFQDESKQLTNVFFLLSKMLEAGYNWQRLNGEEPKKPPTLDDIIDTVGVDDYEPIINSIAETLHGSQRNVEARPAKKKGVNATQPRQPV